MNSSIAIIISKNKIIDNLSSFNETPICFINDLFEALIRIPRQLINDVIHKQLIEELITILEKNLFSAPFKNELNQLSVWFKLLGNKIINLCHL